MTQPTPTDPGEPVPSEFTAVCHTDGCANNGIGHDVWLYPNPPDFPPEWACWCGVCQQPITDLTPVPAPTA